MDRHLRHFLFAPHLPLVLLFLMGVIYHGQVSAQTNGPQLAEPSDAAGEGHVPRFAGDTHDTVKRLLREAQLPAQSVPHGDGAAVESRSDPPFVSALKRAHKRSAAEISVEAYSEVLVQCQQQQAPTATTALMRSDSQQAHCFRF